MVISWSGNKIYYIIKIIFRNFIIIIIKIYIYIQKIAMVNSYDGESLIDGENIIDGEYHYDGEF